MPPFRGDATRLGTSSQLPEASGLFNSYPKAQAGLKSAVTVEKGAPELNQVAEEGLSRSEGISCSSRHHQTITVIVCNKASFPFYFYGH